METLPNHGLTFDFPEIFTAHTRYREPPYHIVEEFKAHVKDTNQPEHFPGLYWGHIKKNEPFEILHVFAVDRKKRPQGDYIPCPICKTREKFLEGSLVYIFSRQCIAIIGHDCAAADVKQAAWAKKKADDNRLRIENFLMEWLQKVPGTLRAIEDLRPLAVGIESIHHQFRSGAPRIQKELRQLIKAGGGLVLTEMVDNVAAGYSDQQPKKVARDHYFGALQGQALLKINCKFVSDLRVTENLLLGFADCEDEEAALERTVKLMDDGEGPKAVEYIVKAFQSLKNLVSDVSKARQFFTQEHIDSIRVWGTHGLQASPFTVERHISHQGVVVTFARKKTKDDDVEYARLVLPSALLEWSAAGEIISDFDASLAIDKAQRFAKRKSRP